MGFVWEFQDGPIPIGDWTNYFRLLGYAADGVTNEFDWFGQAIVEWDENSNEISFYVVFKLIYFVIF